MKELNEKELRRSLTFKNIIFRFFFLVNRYRTIRRSQTIFMIAISFFQIFYILEFLIIYRNKDLSIQDFNSNYSIFDVVGIMMRFSLVMPIIEVDSIMLPIFFNIIIVFTYFLLLSLIICMNYVFYCIIKEKEVIFTFTLSYISALFKYCQHVLYLPILYVLLYSSLGVFHDQLHDFSNNNFVNTLNIILVFYLMVISLAISILNNDSINRYDNALCRKETDLEKLMFYVKTILFFTLLFRDSLSTSVSNIFCVIASTIIFYIIYRQIVMKYYYDNLISKIFAAFTVCYLEKVLDGLFKIFIDFNSNENNLTTIVCFFLNYKIFDYHFKSMDTVILIKNIGNLKDIDEMISYMENLEEQTNKCNLGDEKALSQMAGYIINHKTFCNHTGCPLNLNELFHPLTNRSVDNGESIYQICKNEVILAHLIKEIFITLGDKFTGNVKYHFAYSNFLIFHFGNPILALIEIEKSFQFSASFQQEYSLFLLKQIANDRLLNNPFYISSYANANVSISDIIDVIVFDILSKQFEYGIEECSRLKINFWKALKENRVSIEDLLIKGKNYINKKKYVAKLWKSISEFSKNHNKLNDLYMLYKDYICDDNDDTLNNDKVKKQETDLNDTVHKRFFDDTGFVIINSNLGINIGNINYHNKTINKIFKYNNDELIGKNISIVQPDSIGKVHNKFISNFIQTGKNKVIGKNYPHFAKDKEKFLIPIYSLILPLPNISSKSQILGLIRERRIEGSIILVNEYGIIDCFSRELMKYDYNLDPTKELNGLSLYIFYLFPELIFSNDQEIFQAKKPIFIKEKKLLEITSLNAYFDVDMIKIIQELESSSRKKDVMSKKKKIKKDLEKSSLDKQKILIYDYYKKICSAIKDSIKNQKEFKFKPLVKDNANYLLKNPIPKYESEYTGSIRMNPQASKQVKEDNFTDYYEYYLRYKRFMDSAVEHNKGEIKKKVYKRQFVVKIQPLKYSYKDKICKVYIFELSIPPSDVESHRDGDDLDSKEYETKEIISFNKNEVENVATRNVDDTGSVSTTRDNNNSIQTVVQRLREENKKDDNFHKSSYMNYLLYLLVLVLISFIVFFNIKLRDFTNQQDVVFQTIYNCFKFKKNLLYLRKYVYLKNLNLTLENNSNLKIQAEYQDLNTKIINISKELLELNTNMTDMFLNIQDKEYIEKIIEIKYSYHGENFIINDIIDNLILLSLYISQPSLLNNSTDIIKNGYLKAIFNKTIDISLNMDYALFFIISNTNNLIQIKFDEILLNLISLYHSFHDNIFSIIIIGYIVFCSIAILIFLFIFMILKERYNYNQTIFECLKQISNLEIDEIVIKIEQFLNVLNTNSNYIETTSGESRSLDGEMSLMDKSNTNKEIVRDENIFVSFFVNISLIILLLITHMVLNYFLTAYYIKKFETLSHFSFSVLDSNFKNLQLISNFRDVYISNNTAYYNDNKLVSNFLNSSFYEAKAASDNIFYEYTILTTELPSETNITLSSVFYNDLCSNSNLNIICDSKRNINIFKKGLRYTLTNFTNQIEKIIFYFETTSNKDYFSIFINNNSYFLQPSNLEENELSQIYDFLISRITTDFNNYDLNFSIVIIVVSAIGIFLIFISITVNWKKYANKIKLEEYMSNKIIAEIPIYIITNNKVIREHLLDFSNKT